MAYTPSYELLKKYADVLVKFALRNGNGVNEHDVVFVQLPECAKALYIPLQASILESGAHPIIEYIPDGVARHFFENANHHQVTFYPSHYLHGKIEQMTHVISIIAEHDKHELNGIDPKKIAARVSSRHEYKTRRFQKELEGKMTWTLGLFGTPAMAAEAGLSEEEYRNEIINACYLDFDDPIAKWKETFVQMDAIKQKLDNLMIEWVNVKGEDSDINIKIGKDRQWLCGSGHNIPSFEVFTSPDRRGTNGWIRCNQPLYYYGQLIKGMELKFENGIIVEAKAEHNDKFFQEMLNIENANKLGEFSLTDSRFSRITKFMGETLYDENVGGRYGNTHIAIGSAYESAFRGDITKLSKEERDSLGFNKSAEHRDIISTTDRVVTATLANGEKLVIYEDGKFTI